MQAPNTHEGRDKSADPLDIPIMVECTRCHSKHPEADRIVVAGKPIAGIPVSDLVCPKCGWKNYYILTPDGKRRRA